MSVSFSFTVFYSLIRSKTTNAKHLMHVLCSLLLHGLWWAPPCSFILKGVSIRSANKTSGVQQQRLPFGFARKGTFLRTLPLVHFLICPVNKIDATGSLVAVLVFRSISLSWSFTAEICFSSSLIKTAF